MSFENRPTISTLGMRTLLTMAVLAGCGAAGQETEPVLPRVVTVSYAGTAEWLEELDPQQSQDQIQDWIVLGFASVLGIEAETLRDFVYDKTPVRDPLFDDLSANRIGPGRSLPEGGTLHLLIPAEDPHPDRTVGSLLDDHRKDTGADPATVRIHSFVVDTATSTARIETGPEMTAAQARAEHGYFEMKLADLGHLRHFLDRCHHLSQLAWRGDALWGAGWQWPGVPSGKISVKDLSVLLEGYREARFSGGGEPGFSLDPALSQSPLEAIEVLSERAREESKPLLEDLGETLALALPAAAVQAEDDPEGAAFAILSTIAPKLARIERQDPELATRMSLLLAGQPVYQQARYDGGLQGSEAGMTYFYTDLVAKAWPMERGSGSPSGIVPGFVSDLASKTPWGHCTTAEESGRLWFGLREEAVLIGEDVIDFGSVATRLFSKVTEPDSQEEVEPSYNFGRIMRWWDRNYVPMADYEPQYHRLDQLMRWGTAFAWLLDTRPLVEFPVEEGLDPHKLRFDRWLQAHPELKWSYDVPFVKPLQGTTEALLTIFSDTFDDCGFSGGFWSGGISNPRIGRIGEIARAKPELRASVARSGLDRTHTSFSEVTRTGRLGNATLERTLEPVVQGRTTVRTSAAGRRVWSFSRIKAWSHESARRAMSMDLHVADGRITQRLTVGGGEVGELSAHAAADRATVTWRPGVLSRARRALNSIQEALPGNSLQHAVSRSRAGSLSFTDANGRVFLRLDTPGKARWISLEKGLAEPGDLSFRLGAPGTDGPQWFTARVAAAPEVHLASAGLGDWFSVQPTQGHGPALLRGRAPPPQTRSIKWTARVLGNEAEGGFYVDRSLVQSRVGDPVFGIDGSDSGASLMRVAAEGRLRNSTAPPGLSEPLHLGGASFALVEAGRKATLVPVESDFHKRIQAALRESDGPALVKMNGPDPQIVSTVSPEPPLTSSEPVQPVQLTDLVRKPPTPAQRGPPTYLESKLGSVVLEEGVLIPPPAGTGRLIRIVEVKAPPAVQSRPEWRLWDGTEWVLPISSAEGEFLEFDWESPTIRLIYEDSDCADEAEGSQPKLRCQERLSRRNRDGSR